MSLLALIGTLVAVISGGTLAWFWWKQPKLSMSWRLALFMVMAVLPAVSAGTSTVAGLKVTTERSFCGDCHVMDAHVADAEDPESNSLASLHTRNKLFGGQSCYTCHADYSMFGYPLTKLNGMVHMYHYYFGGYLTMPLEEAVPKLHLYKEYPNRNCMLCHTGQARGWKAVPDHASAWPAIESGQMSCSSPGCHGAAHPFSKTDLPEPVRRDRKIEEPRP